jgi:cyclophilin family peptidyl-prolyl cis-trans isomerase
MGGAIFDGGSIYGKFFDDENYMYGHNIPYRVGMSNLGEKNTNSCQFYITANSTTWLDNFNVCFGEIVDGFEVVDRLTTLIPTWQGKIKQNVVIVNCGECTNDDMK